MPHRVIKSIAGRRGSALTVIGFIFVPIAFSQIGSQPAERARALQWLPDWITIGTLGWIFMAATLVALICGLFSRWLPTWSLSLGYGLAFVPPVTLAAIYAVAFALSPWMGGAVSFSIFAGYAALIYLIAGWEEPRPSPPMTDEQRQMLREDVG